MNMLDKLLNFINPQPFIGGLEISESDLRFACVKNKNVFKADVKLPVGVIEDGKIKDRSKLIFSLKELRDKIDTSKKGKNYVIVSIPDGNVYTEIFYLPIAAENNLEEAADLNLQMISPIELDSAYYDWQLIGEKIIEGNEQFELIGAFAPKRIIDEYESVLEEAGFGVAAMEFPALSVMRAVIDSEGDYRNGAYLLAFLGGDGLTFFLVKNANLFFVHFVSWNSAYGEKRKIIFESFKKLIIDETKRVLNFYENHWQDKLNDFLLVSPGLTEEISKIISENFLSLSLKTPVVKKGGDLPAEWFCAYGAALRGLISRSSDTIVSLASVGTEEKFNQDSVFNFIRIWRNIILSSLFFVVLMFAAADFFLINTENSLDRQLATSLVLPEEKELEKLNAEAVVFNEKADLVIKAYSQTPSWSPLFGKLKELSGDKIIIDRILIQSPQSPLILVGRAKSEEDIINFKKLISEQNQFSDVNLPLSGIAPINDEMFGFSISFIINSLEF